jgi:hypothetical protein
MMSNCVPYALHICTAPWYKIFAVSGLSFFLWQKSHVTASKIDLKFGSYYITEGSHLK